MPQRDLTTIDTPATGRAEAFDTGIKHGPEACEIGQWYWVHEVASHTYNGRKKGEKYKWLGCVMEIGTNYVGLQSTKIDGSYSTTRVHFKDFEKKLTFEPNADAYIQQQIGFYQGEVNRLLGCVQEETRKLGVIPQEQQIGHFTGDGGNALAVISTQVDTTAYKNALVKAKEETLPDLFKQIEDANKNLAGWMVAPTLPMQANIGPMKDSIKTVEERIYTIELYAGLTEEATQCCEGEPAPWARSCGSCSAVFTWTRNALRTTPQAAWRSRTSAISTSGSVVLKIGTASCRSRERWLRSVCAAPRRSGNTTVICIRRM
jgi:hypothetical protein